MQGAQNMKVLFLGFWTPPVVRPRAIMAGKIIPELKKQGVEPVVITYENYEEWDSGLQIHKIPAPYKPKVKNKFIRKIFALWREWRYFRDIAEQAGKVAKESGISVIFSFSNPQESNILGAMLKKKLGVPFVSHFSDPWVDNPYKTFSGPAWWKAKLQEKFVVKHSDGIVFTNQAALDLVMKKYSADWTKKALVIPHSFDPKDYSEEISRINSRVNSREKFVISHIGAFYKERTPEPFFKAVKGAVERNTELSEKLEIKLIGAENDYTGYKAEQIEDLAVEYGVQNLISIISKVNYKDSLKYMKEADCLVVLDADFSGSPFFPSKVVDYAGSGKPIVGVSPERSPTSDFLRRLGYRHFSYGQIGELAEYIDDLVYGRVVISLNREFLEQFNVTNTVALLIEKFKEIVNR